MGNRWENRRNWRNGPDKRGDNFMRRENTCGHLPRFEGYAGRENNYGRDRRTVSYGGKGNNDNRGRDAVIEGSKRDTRWKAPDDQNRFQDFGIKDNSQNITEGASRGERLN